MSLLYTIRGKKIAHPFIDSAILAASYMVSYLVIFYPRYAPHGNLLAPLYFAALIASVLAANYFFQVYRVMWAYSNISDMYRLLLAGAVGFAVFVFALVATSMDGSGAHLFMTFMMAMFGLVFYRVLMRAYHVWAGSDGKEYRRAAGPAPAGTGKNIIVIGAGEAGRTILGEYLRRGLGKLIAGFADDDPAKIGKILNGKMVFCDTKAVNRMIDGLGISEVIIAIPSASPDKIDRIASNIRREHRSVPIKVLPSQFELDERKPLSISLRDITIADLLGREEVRIDTGVIEKKFAGKTILITGAGGSIGSEICRQLLKFDIRKLVAVGRGEYSMYNLIRTLNEDAALLSNGTEIAYRIADIKDYRLMDAVFRAHRPDIVFHAAAHKHVPLMEFNEAEAVQNNVQGTKNLLDLSVVHECGGFVFISTDKAVNPVNVMGATKRMAEIITNQYHRTKGLKTAIVRFGNVIGSRGSVIPLFMEQIERGGPVTVTHPDVTRYFMSIPEASLLVINAAAYSAGGELFALNMGKQYRVAEIAQRLIEFYGYRSDDEIRIEYTGLRPGEKMQEDLFYSDGGLVSTQNDKVFILTEKQGADAGRIDHFLNNELPVIVKYSPGEIRRIVKEIVPEFEYDPARDDTAPNSKLVS